MKRLAIFAVLLVLSFVATAAALEPGDILWTRTYGGGEWDDGYSVQQTSDGGYIIAGNTESFGAGNNDVYLLKTDPSGDVLWTRTYGGRSSDYSFSVQQTSDGGYVIAGYRYTFGPGHYDVYLLKTNANGDTLWTRTYGGRSSDYSFSVQQTSDGGYIIAGYTRSFGAGYTDVYLVKTDSEGDTLWTRTYGGSDWDFGGSVQQTSDGGYIIAAETYSFGAGLSDVYLVKTDSSGHSLWTRAYGGSERDRGYSVQQTLDGGYIIAGETESFGAGGSDVYLLKTDSSGDIVWTRTYGGRYFEWGSSVQQTSDGGYVIAGETGSFGAGVFSVYLLKTDSEGDTLWTRTYGGSDYDGGNSVQQTSDGGYIIAGYTMSFREGGGDVYLLKTDSSGDTLWTRTYGGSEWDRGYSVQQTSDGRYIIAGRTESFGAGGPDVYLLRIAGSGGNQPPVAFIDDISPNPAPEGQEVSFSGHGQDPDGQVVAYRWISSRDGTLSNASSFSTSDLSAGTHTIYFKVQDNDGQWSASDTETLEITGGELPIAFIDDISPNPAQTGEEVSFAGHGEDPGGSIVAYYWESNIDGELSRQASFTTTNLSEGTHVISFKVQDDDGYWSREETEILKVCGQGQLCASFTHYPKHPYQEQLVTFTSTSTGPIDAWDWDFGEGRREHGEEVTHRFGSARTYTVTHTVMSSQPFWVDFVEKEIEVRPSASGLVIDDIWMAPEEFEPREVVVASALIRNVGGRNSGRFDVWWYFDGDCVAWHTYRDGLDADDYLVDHSYPTSFYGDHRWPDDYNPHELAVSVVPYGQEPVVFRREFSAGTGPLIADAGGPYVEPGMPPFLGFVSATVDFSGGAHNGNPPYSFCWYFGDGNVQSDAGPEVSHSYLVKVDDIPKTYEVTLAVVDDDEVVATSTTSVTIGTRPEGAPVAHADGPYEAEPTEPITFDGSGSYDPEGGQLDYHWFFGDGDEGYGVNPTHAYGASGRYDVILEVTDPEQYTSYDNTVANIGEIIGFTPPYESSWSGITDEERFLFGGTDSEGIISDASDGSMGMHLFANTIGIGSSLLGARCRISGPAGGSFSVNETGDYAIIFCFNSTGAARSQGWNPLPGVVITILTAGQNLWFSLPFSGGGHGTETRGLICYLFEDGNLKESRSIGVGNAIYDPWAQWEDLRQSVIMYPMRLEPGKDYSFSVELYGRCASGAALDVTGGELVNVTTLDSVKAVKLAELVMSREGIAHPQAVENASIDPTIKRARFLLRRSSSNLSLALETPDGRSIDPGAAYSDPDVSFGSTSGYEYYEIESPMPGTWHLRITQMGNPEEGSNSDYEASVTAHTDLTMSLWLDNDQYKVSDTLKVMARLVDSDGGIGSAKVAAVVESPSGVSELVLLDDGSHGDGEAGDGTYANYFRNATEEGRYSFRARASGMVGGERFGFTREESQVTYLGKSRTPRPSSEVAGRFYSRGEASVPVQFSLSQNYPNPFNPITSFRYALPTDCHVQLTIYNIMGQKVTTLVSGFQSLGYKSVSWDATDYPSGIYFYKLVAGDRTATKRMTVLK